MSKQQSKERGAALRAGVSQEEAALIAQLYAGKPILGPQGALTPLVQRLLNAALEGEMDVHLSQERQAEVEAQSTKRNRRNGHTRKQVRTNVGPVEVHPPRDREGTFSPQLIGKWERQLHTGLDEQIRYLYGLGNSVEDIRRQLLEIYGLSYSDGAISTIVERVWAEVVTWQQRLLQTLYVVIYLDAVYFKVREQGRVVTQAIYTVYGIDAEGERDVLGLYLGEAEGAHQWARIVEDLRRRGVEDVLFFSVDGLAGFAEAILSVFPQSLVQRCIVHMIRSSTKLVAEKDRKALCADLRQIYTASDVLAAELALEAFEHKWGRKYAEVGRKWRENWAELMVFMDFSAAIRRLIYTTNPVEGLHRQIRQVTKAKGPWTNGKALMKQLYLALQGKQDVWSKRVYNWREIQRELIAHFGERYSRHLAP